MSTTDTVECLVCGEQVPRSFLSMIDHSMKHEREEREQGGE